MAEQARRDKAEDAKAKAAIKAQIEADKKERAERTAREKAVRDGTALPAVAASTSMVAASSTSVPSSEYKETRLQIRLSAGGGKPIVVTLPSDKSSCLPVSFISSFHHHVGFACPLLTLFSSVCAIAFSLSLFPSRVCISSITPLSSLPSHFLSLPILS